jgi:HK97 family phage portal protein
VPFVRNDGTVDRIKPAMAALGSAPTSILLNATTAMTYEAIYKAQPAVRTVVGFLARNIAELGLDVFTRGADDDRSKVRDHPLALLLSQPFFGSKWTKYRLINWTVHERCIFDTAYWLKTIGPDGRPGVLPVPARFITPQGENFFTPDYYRITGSRGFKDFPPDQVVVFNGYNPDDPRIGHSAIETLRQVLAEEYAASQYREQMWKNGARVGGYISRSEKAPKWSPQARARFTSDWNAQYTGQGPGAGGTPVLEDGMTYIASGITPRDAQYAESRQLTREEVAVAFHVNPAILGVTQGSSSGQGSTAVPEIRKQLYADSLGPWLEEMSQDIECQLLPDLDPGGVGKVYVEFNLKRKMQGSFEEQAAAISASVGGPWMTRNEARALNNLPALAEAEDLITPLNVVTGGLASPRDTAPDNPSNEESNGQLPGPKPAEVGA